MPPKSCASVPERHYFSVRSRVSQLYDAASSLGDHFSVHNDDSPERCLFLVFKGAARYVDRICEETLIIVS